MILNSKKIVRFEIFLFAIITLIAVYKEISLILKSKKIVRFEIFFFAIITLIAVYREISLILKSKNHVFYNRVLCLLSGTPNSKHKILTLILKTTSDVYY